MALWLVAMLATPVFAAVAASSYRALFVGAATAVASFVWMAAGTGPLAELAGVAATLGSAVVLVRPHAYVAAAVAGGLLAGTCGALAFTYGAGWFGSFGVGMAMPVLTTVLARRSAGFAPPRVREEALLLSGVGGLVAAIGPGVSEGWRAAQALTAVSDGNAMRAVPVWVLAAAVASAIAGAGCALWSRR